LEIAYNNDDGGPIAKGRTCAREGSRTAGAAAYSTAKTVPGVTIHAAEAGNEAPSGVGQHGCGQVQCAVS